MLKSSLRMSYALDISENIESKHHYEKQKFVGKIIDELKVYDSSFHIFVFADCGMKHTKFFHCRFNNCIFSGCYMKYAEFTHCEFIGCHFEICTTTGIKLINSTIEYAEFLRCIIPYEELVGALTDKHSLNDVMLLNCAAEAHRIGRWREASKFVAGHNVEQRNFWKKMIFSRSGYYERYGYFSKFRALLRLTASWIFAFVFGDNISLLRLLGLGFGLIFVICPILVMFSDSNTQIMNDNGLYIYMKYYFSFLYSSINMTFGANIKSEYMPKPDHREMLELGFRVTIITYFAVLGNVVTKTMGSGPRW